MARFDLLLAPESAVTYLLDVQSDFLSHLNTRLVIPVVLAERFKRPLIKNLHIPVVFRDRSLIIATDLITSVSVRQCGKSQGSLKEHAHDITAAIDFLLQGF